MTKNAWGDANWWKAIALDGADMVLTDNSGAFEGKLKEVASGKKVNKYEIAATDSAKF